MAKKKNAFNTITPLSKALAMILFIALPLIGFYLGMQYQKLAMPVTEDTTVAVDSFRVNEGNISKYLDFSIPAGWKLENNNEQESGDNIVKIFSPDFVAGTLTYAPDKGALITITARANSKKTLDVYVKQMPIYEKDQQMEPAMISGLKAYTWHDSYAGIHRRFIVKKGNIFWKIALHSGSAEADKKYTQQINDFVASLKFK